MRSRFLTASVGYGPLVPLYAQLARWYSGGAIPACQHWAVDEVAPGDRVLFAGPGPGTDVLRASQAGLRVTAIDRCPVMLAATKRRLQNAGVAERVELVHADLRQHPPAAEFDVVIAQFFLNVFPPDYLPQVLSALAGYLKPAGRLIIGDFAPLVDGGRCWQQRYHDLPMHILARFGANARHPVHDLPVYLNKAGFQLLERRRFRLFSVGPDWIEGLVATPGTN